MPEYTLTVLDTPGIQKYIFGSNRLRENIGASELVRQASIIWPLQILEGMGETNVADPRADDPARRLDDNKHIEDNHLLAEVVYVGGGNVVILFAERQKAQEFVTQWSRWVIEEAPDLELAAVHVPLDWDRDYLGDKVQEAMEHLMHHKQSRRPSTPLLGMGMTVACQSTGLPATTTNAEHGAPKSESTPISDAVGAKLEAVQGANDWLCQLLPGDVQRDKYEFALDFDDFGRSKGEMSYIAVVHADGNGMGDFFRVIAKNYEDSRTYIQKVRSASIHVAQAAGDACRRTVTDLLTNMDFDDRGDPQIAKTVPVRDGKLPFRPLVFGGDDVTFVCDGRLGLPLAALYLRYFEEEAQNHNLDLHACAGIAVVKTHYPFARAYQLSEALAGNAKQYVRQKGTDFSALDWHFAAGGLLGSIKEIRDREYTVGAGKLYVRPLPLRADGDWGNWPNFEHVVIELKESAAEHLNKVMALREVLRDGPDSVKRFLLLYGDLPQWEGAGDDMQATGWVGDVCGYFDPIEAMDFYVPLEVKR